MRRFQEGFREAERSTSSTPEGAAGCPPISLPEAPPRQGSEDPLRSTYEKVLDELHPQSEWHRQIPQEAGKDTERWEYEEVRRQKIKEGRGYKESRPAGGKKGWQKKTGRREYGF